MAFPCMPFQQALLAQRKPISSLGPTLLTSSDQRVPNARSPASPSPGTMYPLSFSSASIMAEYTFSPAQRFPQHITPQFDAHFMLMLIARWQPRGSLHCGYQAWQGKLCRTACNCANFGCQVRHNMAAQKVMDADAVSVGNLVCKSS